MLRLRSVSIRKKSGADPIPGSVPGHSGRRTRPATGSSGLFCEAPGRRFLLAASLFFAGTIAFTTALPGKARPIAEQTAQPGLEPGQAIVRYLYHSGWAVTTKNHLLIFDYTEPSARSVVRSLESGFIDPAGLSGREVTVFVSHGHADHDDPSIQAWRGAGKRIRYVWGWDGAGAAEDIHFGSERRTVNVDGLEIINIHHEFDGLPESAFLVKTDGLTILHAGDHGHGRGLENPVFKGNLLYLAEQAPKLDFMFTPTFGGEIDALRILKPRVVFPMHDGGNERQYALFAKKVEALGLDVAVGAADRPGTRFFYSGGRLR